MASTRTYSRSFAGGELSAEMFGRIDDAKFQAGAAKVLNCLVTPTGAVKNRAGFAFVKATKANGAARLIPFTFSLNQTMVIELGNGYARFHTNGATLQYSATQAAFVASHGVTYTVASPAVFTATSHGFSNGLSVVAAITGIAPPGASVSYPTGMNAGPYTVVVVDANNFTLQDASGNAVNITAAAAHGGLAIQPDYAIGALVSYSGSVYYRQLAVPTYMVFPSAEIDSNPATDGYWYGLPSDLTYEIPTPYAAADLFSIHYVQSNDVMTLVHPNYPPQTLARHDVTNWTMTAESFGPPLDTPQNVAVAASPGYLAKISSVATGGTGFTGQALITTASSHTLALGSPVYVANWSVTVSGTVTTLDGFYLVSAVPVDGSGNLIANQLYLMDYNGNNVMYQSGGSYSGSASIQYGTKIFNITSPYAVQAFGPDGISSSLLSASASVLNNLDVPGSFNTVSWSAVTGAQSYYVYKQLNGLWGFIGQTQTLSFVDNNIAPDMGITPGTPYGVFAATGDYPSAVCYFQQRKCFGGTLNAPNNAWMSNSGTESMFSYSLPSLATDAVVFRVAATQADVIQHMIPMLQLIMLTSESEFALAPAGTSSVTPSSIDVNPQSYIGASNVQPTVINTTMLYAAARGGHVRELGYAWTVNGYMTNDLSLRAAHLFDGLTIVDQAYSKSPYPMVWFVSSNGKLLGLTYIPEEQIGAWHQHDTQGTFESVACVSEGAEDVLYAVVNRTVNGATVRYVERMASRFFASLTGAFLVDAGITQTFGAAVTTVSGLTWLEGCTVSVLADGGVQTQKVVTGGAITLDHSAETVTVGLPYVSDLQTLPPVLQVDGYGQGRMKNVNKGWVRVYQSGALLVGPDENNLTEIAVRTNEPWGTAPSLQTGELPVMTTPSWQDSGQVLIRQVNPLPMEVVSLTLEVAIGG